MSCRAAAAAARIMRVCVCRCVCLCAARAVCTNGMNCWRQAVQMPSDARVSDGFVLALRFLAREVSLENAGCTAMQAPTATRAHVTPHHAPAAGRPIICSTNEINRVRAAYSDWTFGRPLRVLRQGRKPRENKQKTSRGRGRANERGHPRSSLFLIICVTGCAAHAARCGVEVRRGRSHVRVHTRARPHPSPRFHILRVLRGVLREPTARSARGVHVRARCMNPDDISAATDGCMPPTAQETQTAAAPSSDSLFPDTGLSGRPAVALAFADSRGRTLRPAFATRVRYCHSSFPRERLQ
jgi:hypothetical protein